MTRPILDEAHIHPAIRETIANRHADIVAEVQAALAANDVVVVGMKQNPMPRRWFSSRACRWAVPPT